jgi:hypothetical protein
MSVSYPSASSTTVVAAVVAVMSVQPTSENVTESQLATALLAAQIASMESVVFIILYSLPESGGFLLIDESIKNAIRSGRQTFICWSLTCRSSGWSLYAAPPW